MDKDYEIVDMKNFKRVVHAAVFRNSIQPQYCVSFELDITNYLNKIKEKNLSFTFAFIHAVTKCANQIEEFRYRFKDGDIVLYNTVNTSFTYICEGDDLFKVVEVEMTDDLMEYAINAEKKVKSQKEYFTGPPANNVYQFSPMPWVSYTHISHTASGNKENAIPLFDFGKYFERDGKIIIPFSVQVHHSFVDGLHIGKLAELLQNYFNNFNIAD